MRNDARGRSGAGRMRRVLDRVEIVATGVVDFIRAYSFPLVLLFILAFVISLVLIVRNAPDECAVYLVLPGGDTVEVHGPLELQEALQEAVDQFAR